MADFFRVFAKKEDSLRRSDLLALLYNFSEAYFFIRIWGVWLTIPLNKAFLTGGAY
jgi:hypothetical protein